MKIISSILFFILITFHLNAQSINEDKISLENFVKRMYDVNSFEGVKIVETENHKYLLSVISLDKSKNPNESILNRIAQVKAQSQANTFLNGAEISMDMVITTTERKDDKNRVESLVQSVEQIKQNSQGFSQGLELLTNIDHKNGINKVFFYFREMK